MRSLAEEATQAGKSVSELKFEKIKLAV